MKTPKQPKLYANRTEESEEARKLSRALHPSRPWEPLVKETRAHCVPVGDPAASAREYWYNSQYLVAVYRYVDNWPFGGGPWARLGINSHVDGSARHDWREFQKIKNEIVGEEWEALELYPAESRLIDPSNYFYLFCCPAIPIGMYDGRRILSPRCCYAPQRDWAPQDMPKDCDARIEEFGRVMRSAPL